MAQFNWVYGTLRPTHNFEAVIEQMVLAHRFRNKLCELELVRREEYETLTHRMFPKLKEVTDLKENATAKIEQIESEIKAYRSKHKTTRKAPAELRDAIKELKEYRKEKSLECEAIKKKMKESDRYKKAQSRLAENHKERIKEAYNVEFAALYWPTKTSVMADTQSFGSGSPPKFEKWTGEGTIAVQLQKGATPAELLACEDNRLRIYVHGKDRAEVWLRIGSVKSDPVWAKVPVVWDRELPKETAGIPQPKIKWAYLHMTKIADRYEWRLRLAIAAPPRIRRSSPKPFVAVHLGWRKINGCLRVATCFDGSGNFREFKIPAKKLNTKEFLESLQSIRDRRFNHTISWLCRWIDTYKQSHELPEWLADARKTMKSWKNQQRLQSLCLHWRKHRFYGDETVFDWLVGNPDVPTKGWYRWDRHLWQWKCSGMKKLPRWRKNEYRIFAKELAAQYDRCSLIVVNWAELMEKPDVKDEQTPAIIRWNSRLAAVSELSKCIKEAFGADCVIDVDPENVTRECHSCGKVSDKALGLRQHHTCRRCGLRWDVDHNAVQNEYARAQVLLPRLPKMGEVMQNRLDAYKHPKKSKRQLKLEEGRRKKKDDQDDDQDGGDQNPKRKPKPPTDPPNHPSL